MGTLAKYNVTAKLVRRQRYTMDDLNGLFNYSDE